ncbi:hypothetical protein Tco_1104950 [Tanacetum coccineum]
MYLLTRLIDDLLILDSKKCALILVSGLELTATFITTLIAVRELEIACLVSMTSDVKFLSEKLEWLGRVCSGGRGGGSVDVLKTEKTSLFIAKDKCTEMNPQDSSLMKGFWMNELSGFSGWVDHGLIQHEHIDFVLKSIASNLSPDYPFTELPPDSAYA